MYITMLKTVTGQLGLIPIGETLEVDDATGEAWVTAEIAVRADGIPEPAEEQDRDKVEAEAAVDTAAEDREKATATPRRGYRPKKRVTKG